jgi:RNA-directed DNA polymerase
MTKRMESPSAKVPLAQQAEATHPLWRCAKPCVWTVRMLTTLVEGVEGGKWFRLFDKVFAERNLLASLQQVAANDGAPGVDHVTASEFVGQFPDSIWELSDGIKAGAYEPRAIRRVHIPKPGTKETRPLGIPTVRDRVVQTAIVNVIEPIFERDFAEQSYGFRPERGCRDALRRVDQLLRTGHTHVVDADLKGYFDSIPHDRLMDRLKEKIADGQVLSLIEKFLKASIMEDGVQWTPEAGAPQGAVLSPLLSNVYLDPLDHLMAREGFQMVRYADDFVILCRTADDAHRALALVQTWVAENGLTLHPTKTRVVDVAKDGFDFLGYHFHGTPEGIRHRVREKSVRKLKDTLRPKTKRTSGQSLRFIVADINRVLRGWFAYFQHDQSRVFGRLDCWLRQRLRAILRKRSKRRGVAKGWDFHRWPNAFFAGQGLFSLVAAHAAARQSSRR